MDHPVSTQTVRLPTVRLQDINSDGNQMIAGRALIAGSLAADSDEVAH